MYDNERMIREEFGALCRAFDLEIQKIDHDEFALIGENLVLLVWLDRDGVAVKYLRLDCRKFEVLDIGFFCLQSGDGSRLV